VFVGLIHLGVILSDCFAHRCAGQLRNHGRVQAAKSKKASEMATAV
jgi:hypothetical protein